MNNEDYLEGVRAAQSYYRSQGFSGFTRDVRAEDAIKLFLPPAVEQMTQISMPLPKPRQDWLRGFKEEQVNIRKESLQ
ncbi:MAG: hypothetical protein KAR06_03600 [Deltaproteobacteria bacterium]|nr:hypothetical protein [Deltaproteobacteria bacterium]